MPCLPLSLALKNIVQMAQVNDVTGLGIYYSVVADRTLRNQSVTWLLEECFLGSHYWKDIQPIVQTLFWYNFELNSPYFCSMTDKVTSIAAVKTQPKFLGLLPVNFKWLMTVGFPSQTAKIANILVVLTIKWNAELGWQPRKFQFALLYV